MSNKQFSLPVVEIRHEDKATHEIQGGRRKALRLKSFLIVCILCATASPSHGITEICETPFMEGNSEAWENPNMRFMGVEYLGHSEVSGRVASPYDENYFVIGWVGPPDQIGGSRDFRFAFLRDHGDDPCFARAEIHPYKIGDVNWVSAGGHVPAGQSGNQKYPSHGYMVWSSLGKKHLHPRIAIGKFAVVDNKHEHEIFHLDKCHLDVFTHRGHYPCNPLGIVPVMASNRPVPSNYDITSRPVPFINKALCGPASAWPDFERFCDHGHRLLLVYVGGLRWMEGTKNHPEYPPLHPGDEALHHWNGTSIEYVLFRPGDNKVLAEGTIADIKDYEYYNELGDHALFPEVAWNEATGEWTVIWEEFRSEWEIGTGPAWRRWATTIDEDGNVGKLTDLGICFEAATSIGGPKEEKAEKDVSFRFDGHCGLVNMANDYYSMEGIDWAGDRNPTHSSLVSSYSNWYNFRENWPYRSSNQWLDRYAKELLFNKYDEIQKQPYRDRQSIAVIGHPDFRELTRFEQASYLQATYVRESLNNMCKTAFYLVTDNPDAVHSDGQWERQQWYWEEGESWAPECVNRWVLGNASSFNTFVTVWVQLLPPEPGEEYGVSRAGFGIYNWL